jgi:hypothetical protein
MKKSVEDYTLCKCNILHNNEGLMMFDVAGVSGGKVVFHVKKCTVRSVVCVLYILQQSHTIRERNRIIFSTL